MFDIILLIFSLVVVYFMGSKIEKNHYKKIQEREIKLFRFPLVSTEKGCVSRKLKVKKIELVSGSVVIASDYFKDFVSGLRNFFGGRMASYETLVDRARREAILRMREKAIGANIIINMKLETAFLSENQSNRPANVAVIAYGTAITYEKQ